MKGLNLIPQGTKINFVGGRYIAFTLSILMILASAYMLTVRGLNFGIDFTGGTLIEIRTQETPDIPDLREHLNDLDLGAISLQEFGSPLDLLIRLPEQGGGPEVQQKAIVTVQNSLNTVLSTGGYELRRTEFVGPQVGKELKQQGFNAVAFAMLGILGYIWLRFEWQFSVSSVAALLHDTVAVLGFFALTQMEFNLSTVAAILMVAGYSINDTVVVFDRIREDLRRYKKKPLAELFNVSLNQTLSRTTITSLTTLIALIALYIYGGEVLRGFISALIIGVGVGTYSSIYIAASLLLFTDLRKSNILKENVEEPV